MPAVTREFTYYLYLQMNGCVRLVIAALIFCSALEKKPRFALRMVLSLALCTAACFAFAWVRYRYDTVFTRFFVGVCKYTLPMIIILGACEGGALARLRVVCATVAASEIANCLFSLLLKITGGRRAGDHLPVPSRREHNGLGLADFLCHHHGAGLAVLPAVPV